MIPCLSVRPTGPSCSPKLFCLLQPPASVLYWGGLTVLSLLQCSHLWNSGTEPGQLVLWFDVLLQNSGILVGMLLSVRILDTPSQEFPLSFEWGFEGRYLKMLTTVREGFNFLELNASVVWKLRGGFSFFFPLAHLGFYSWYYYKDTERCTYMTEKYQALPKSTWDLAINFLYFLEKESPHSIHFREVKGWIKLTLNHCRHCLPIAVTVLQCLLTGAYFSSGKQNWIF